MEHHLVLAETLTDLLENRFTILGFRFGLDPLLALSISTDELERAFLNMFLLCYRPVITDSN